MNLPVAKAVPGVRSGLVALAVCGLLVGCNIPQSRTQSDQTGRYQTAGKREYANATEIYYLDTQTGRVCTGWIPNAGQKAEDRPATYCTAPP